MNFFQFAFFDMQIKIKNNFKIGGSRVDRVNAEGEGARGGTSVKTKLKKALVLLQNIPQHAKI